MRLWPSVEQRQGNRGLQGLRWRVRRLKRCLEGLTYALFDVLALIGVRASSRRFDLVIVYPGLLGDYVMWLPYARALVQHRQHIRPDERIALLLDAPLLAWARRHFPGVDLIAIERRPMRLDLSYRARTLRSLRRLGVKDVVYAAQPRDFLIGDAIVRALAAPSAVGHAAVFADRTGFDRALSRRWYSHLIPPPSGEHHIDYHRALLAALAVPAQAVQPVTDFAAHHPPPASWPYFILAPGASRRERCWPEQRYTEVAQALRRLRPHWRCVLIGSAHERALCDRIARTMGEGVVNMAGRTSIEELAVWIAHARLVLGNDSSAGHIAALCGTPSLIVLGGGHYARCYPYPAQAAAVVQAPTSIHTHMPCFGCDWYCRYPLKKGRPYPCIEAVTVSQVLAALPALLAQADARAGSPTAAP